MANRKLDWSVVKKLYVDHELGPVEISKLLSCTPESIQYIAKKEGYTRNTSTSRKLWAKQRRIQGLPASNSWKGGRCIREGYVAIWVTDLCKYIPEHRLVWEQTHNQKLPEGWVIHHINGIKSDNRPHNLVAMPRKKHNINTYELLQIARQRIRELEAELKLLQRALDNNQMIFTFNNN